jgi:hypothetical protein
MKMTNTYDKQDRVHRQDALVAGPIKLAAYRVRDPETDEWSKLQFHMTYDNIVMAVMGEDSAKLFVRFINDTLDREAPKPDAA